jgi:hypothetical protein
MYTIVNILKNLVAIIVLHSVAVALVVPFVPTTGLIGIFRVALVATVVSYHNNNLEYCKISS